MSLAAAAGVRVLVLADTHAPRRWKGIPAALVEPLRTADLVLHAGDVCRPQVLDDLVAASGVPVIAVLGNNDGPDVAAWGARQVWEGVLAGVRVAMIHDSGARVGRGRRMRARFPQADLVVYGHSHIPYDAVEDGLRLLNPGSPSDRRRQPVATYGVLVLAAGRVSSSRIVALT